MVQIPIILGLAALMALGGAAVAGSGQSPADRSGLSCGVTSHTANGMLTLEGLLQASQPVTGEYRFALRASGPGGSANISQAGQFSATADSPVSLGSAMVNANSRPHIDFTITVGGKKYDCSQPLATLT